MGLPVAMGGLGREICTYVHKQCARACVSQGRYSTCIHTYVHAHGGTKWRNVNICTVCPSTYVCRRRGVGKRHQIP